MDAVWRLPRAPVRCLELTLRNERAGRLHCLLSSAEEHNSEQSMKALLTNWSPHMRGITYARRLGAATCFVRRLRLILLSERAGWSRCFALLWSQRRTLPGTLGTIFEIRAC
jgi:hypothetical protein